MSSYREQNEWTAEQALSYVIGLEAADEESQYEAFAIAYNYFMNLSKKKISWSVHLEKLAYEFIELAFDNNKHSSIKDVLKSYRSLTQGQHFESLKDVLEHYRDRKLRAILEEDILHENLELVVGLPNIENEEASSTVIFSSFKPENKRKLQELKNKLKIVWDGYKCIVETVRINQNLEDVYKETLAQVFEFVNKYNRKHEFKSFCRTLRSGLLTAFSKRDRSQQQKGFYIDIERTEVNDRNIDIRLEQFKVTIRLGLWQEAFQVLEDIKNLMNVRKGPVKSKIKFKYFENLALLFKRSNYWHYHAFAYYNYYLAAQKNPNLTAGERKALSNILLLSVISIPPVPLESSQRTESQRKIASMMISSNKIPSKSEMFEIIVSAGIVENASPEIRDLWNFMLLDFDLQSLSKGLDLLKKIKGEKSFEEFKVLTENILIFKQLNSISEIYQKIKIESLLTMIPLPRDKIEKILLDSYHQKQLDFILDENQKIIIFEDKSHEKASNPTENFMDIYIDLALEKEKQRKMDGAHIIKKAENFLETSEDYYWNIRPYKIEEFRKKMKKPKQELENEEYRLKVLEKQRAEQQEIEKREREEEALRLADEKKKEFALKKIIISDISEIKQHRVVRIIGKKVEELTDDEIENITIETLNKSLQELKQKIQNAKDNKFKKVFCHVDYLERQRRIRLDPEIHDAVLNADSEKENVERINKNSKADFEEKKAEKERLQKMMQYLEPKIKDEEKKMSDKYDNDLKEFKEKLTNYFKQNIIQRAKDLAAQNKRKKQEEEKRMKEALNDYDYYNTKWTFKTAVPTSGATESASTEQEKTTGGFAGFKMGSKREQAATTQTQPEEKKEEPIKGGQWARKGDKKQEEVPQQPTNSFVPPPAESSDKKKFGAFGIKGSTDAPKKEGEERPRPKRNYVNVN